MKWLTSLPADLISAVVLLVAVVSAAAALMGWVSYVHPPLVFASELALPGLAAAVLAGVLWLVLPARRKPASAGPLALMAVVLWSAMIAPELAGRLMQRRAPPGGEQLKVVQFNLWKDDWSHTREKEAWIRKQDPDVILMQEIGGGSSWLVQHLSDRYPFQTSCENFRYACSLLIMSKERPVEIGSSGVELPTSNWAWARFSRPGGDFVVATVHEPWPLADGEQKMALQTLSRDVPRLKSDAVVLTGDFNAAPWSAPLRAFDNASGLKRQTRLLPTWPAPALGHGRISSPLPLLPIDHIYTGPAWKLVSLERGPDLGSDHYPLAAVLTRPGPKTERAPSGKP
jgi:endonuclease/exonuclease/phosphatase (EEP) superfamily protein YafD